MNPLLLSLCGVCTILGPMQPVGGQVASPDPRSDFLADYEPHAIPLREAYTNVTCLATIQAHNHQTGELCQEMVTEAKYSFKNFSLKTVSYKIFSLHHKKWLDFSDRGGIDVQNPKYGFGLRKGNDGTPILTSMVPANTATRPNLVHLCFPYANQMPTGRSYLDLAKDPNNTVVAYRNALFRGVQAKELTVETNVLHPESRETTRARIAFYFQPESKWVCIGCRCSEKNNKDLGSIEEIYEYDMIPGQFPIPKTVENWLFTDATKPKGVRYRKVVISDFKRFERPFPDADFTLTAYGMPEPESLPEPPAGTPVVPGVETDALAAPDVAPPSRMLPIILGTAIFIALAIVFRFLRKRAVGRSTAANTQPSQSTRTE